MRTGLFDAPVTPDTGGSHRPDPLHSRGVARSQSQALEGGSPMCPQTGAGPEGLKRAHGYFRLSASVAG